MSITFACEQCGQSYRVPENLGGKRVKCKSCGSINQIPELAAAAAPGPDVYGLDDAEDSAPAPAGTLPGRRPTMGRAPDDDFDGPAPVRAKQKRRKSQSSSGGGGGIGRVIGGIISGFVVLAFIARTFFPSLLGISSAGEYEKLMEAVVVNNENLANSLATIVDEASVPPATAQIRANVHSTVELIKANISKKARKRDIERIDAKYKPRIDFANQRITTEMMRVVRIPGAAEAVESALSELTEFGKAHPELGANSGP